MARDLDRQSLRINTANRPTDRHVLRGQPPSLPPGNLVTTPAAWPSDWRDELHGWHKAASTTTHLGSPRTGVPSGPRLISYGYIMDVPEWPSRPPDDRDVASRLALAAFQPSRAVQRGGVGNSLSPVLLLKVAEWTNPACVQQSRLAPFNAIEAPGEPLQKRM